jgi:peroxiredoxin
LRVFIAEALWQDAKPFTDVHGLRMALTPSNMLPLGTSAPDFDLPGTDGARYNLRSFASGKLLLVAFICNHCPFVKHIQPELARLGRDCRQQGLAMVAISSNDIEAYPADGMDQMRAEAAAAGYVFPYLLDENQQVAKAYDAACTPDFFLFDGARKLIYRGQFDDSRPGGSVPVTGKDLRAAIEAAVKNEPVSAQQKPSMGCNIKWKPGNAP